MKIIALVLACFITLIVKGQLNNFNQSPITLQSPDATQFIRYGNIPMDYSTGVPGISIPLYNVTCGKLSLPIDMSYNASGIKVLDIASTVGLGWSLNAGGLVSRTIMGTDDQQNKYKPYLTSADAENAINYCHNNLTYYNVQNFVEIVNNIYRNSTQQYESQSDRFFYSFNGRSGIFRTDFQTGVAKTVPYSALKISTGTNNAGPYKITAEDGTNYYFAQGEQSGSSPGYNYNTSFYLTKIESPDLTHTINIYYKQDALVSQYIKNYQVIHKVLGHVSVSDPEHSLTIGQDNEFVSQSVPVMPDSIITDNETIQFIYITDRPDPRKSRLNKIKILNRTTREVIRIIEFQQSYFGTAAANNRRLRLDNILFKNNSNTTGEQYGFIYNETPLPPYYNQLGMSEHHNVDYWGYYNAADDVNLLPKEMFDPVTDQPLSENLTPQEKAVYGGNRNPNTATTQACILKEIRYPTGGKTNFEYESHEVTNGYAYNNTVYPIPERYGGLRVKEIKSTANSTSLPIIKTYQYSPGRCTMMQSEIFQYTTTGTYFQDFINNGVVSGTNARDYSATTISTDPLIQMSTGNGSLVLYENVTEYYGTTANNNGSIQYIYDYNDLSPYIFDPGSGGNPLQNGIYLSDYGIYKPQLKTKIISGRNADVKKEEYLYDKFNTGSFITGVKIQRIHPFEKTGTTATLTDADCACPGGQGSAECQWGLSLLLSYYYSSNTTGILDVPLLVQKKETIYPSSGTSDLVTITDYTYDLVTLQPIKEQVVNSKGETLISENKYPTDFSSSAPYNTMVARNILAPVVEQSTYKNSISTQNFLKASKTNYDFWDGINWSSSTTNIIVPRTVGTRSKDQLDYEIRLRYYSYDDKGNVTTFFKENDIKKSYLWGYNKMYPVAQVTNANSNEIFYNSFEENLGWDASLTAYDKTFKRSGLASGRIDKLTTGELYTHSTTWLNINLSTATKFKYSGWIYSNGPSTELYLFMKRPGETNYFSYVDAVITTTVGSWVYIEREFTVPADVTQLNIRLDNNGGGTVWFDDIRLHPSAALMTTYTYSPLIGMTSQTDPNGRTTYYSYDAFNRLQLVKDQDGKILKKICYNYAGQQEDCSVNVTPVWTATGSLRCATSGGINTGYQEREEKDSNPNSSTYNQTQWVSNGYNATACPVPVSCSFTIGSGFGLATSSISSSAGIASFYIVFYSSSITMNPGNSYLVATINGGCQPSTTRTINYSSSGRNWVITIYSNGQMYWYLSPGSTSVSAGTTIGASSLTYNL